MALAASVSQSCSMCFSGKQLRSMIVIKSTRGHQSFLFRNLRFYDFFTLKFSRMYSASKPEFSESLLEEVDKYDTGSSLKSLNKVSYLMDCNLPGIPENERGAKKPFLHREYTINEFDISLSCRRFPSIILGSAPQVDLYDGTTSFPEMRSISESIETRWTQDSLPEAWPSLNANSSGDLTSCSREKLDPLSLSPHSMPFVFEERPDLQITPHDDALELNSTPVELLLDQAISCIPQLSSRHRQQLENYGFHTLRKLLHHFPRTYADLQNAHAEVDDGQYLIFVGRILSSRGIKASYSFSFLEVVVGCEVADSESTSKNMIDDVKNSREKKTVYLHLKRYFRGTRFTFKPFLKSLQGKYKEGDIVCVSGKVRTMPTKDHFEMREYNIDVLKDGKDLSICSKERPYPIYPYKGGLSPDFLRNVISRALQALPVNIDPIPEDITSHYCLLSLRDAYFGIHHPKDMNEADLARKRLIFDEFFYLQLGRLFQMLEGLGSQIEKDGLLDRFRKPVHYGVGTEEWSSLTKNFLNSFPYSLTSSQLNAAAEVIWDLKRPVPMNRLLQGDVGCGKTVVAFLACMEVVSSGYQAAFMVPTELLAIQHYEHLLQLLENMGEVQCKPTVALLTGSMPLKQSRMIRKGLQAGEISMVIGTHSLIAESVEFSALRIAVVDEQHRFGVIQRGKFNSKLYYNSSRIDISDCNESSKYDAYMAPHVLALSATPIPRTLALALYGDMSFTQITDLPPGRVPVETRAIEGNENGYEDVYQMMMDELRDGGKVYLVYPIIEQSEQLPQLRAASADFEVIVNKFQGFNCGLLHGKMRGDEKAEALKKFRCGDTDILLSTQVIEIGVDVPDASMMVVINAERFGIAQLHQLRGRVGRGARKSKCILIASTGSSLNRLKVLEKSSDGFYLANMDLLLRGPGDLLGKKQSGHLPEFPIARLEVDGNILQEAHHAALKILSTSHDLEKFPALKAELSMRQPLCLLGD